MYKSLASLAAATVLATFAAADVDQPLAGQQQKAEEFTSQRRRYRRGRYVVRRGYWGPGYGYYGPRYRYYGYPYAYANPYPYYYRRPGISFGIGPFGFHAW